MSRNKGEALTFIGVGCLTAIGVFILATLLGALLIMLGWNMSMPSIFNLKEVNFVEAMGLSWVIGGLVAPRTAAQSSFKSQ